MVYAATAARSLTFWDAGEFLTAFATFGVPHPPGTPLFVALGRTWTLGLGLIGVRLAFAGNLFSAACTAAAGGCTAWLVARWTRSGLCGLAAALCAGTTATVWANATEAEVYAASLALACAAVVAGDVAGTRQRARGDGGARATVAAAYALALAVPLHLSALVASPAVAWLAASGRPTGERSASAAAAPRGRAVPILTRRAAILLASAAFAAGVGTARWQLAGVGAVTLVMLAVESRRRGPDVVPRPGEAVGTLAAAALGLSAVLVLLVRARHHPWLDQGAPRDWPHLVDVVARRQYAVAPPWPRQAPWWLQIANLGEWADWQFALGTVPGAPPNPVRTPLTLAFAALGLLGSAWHRRRDRRSWWAVLLLLLSGSIGVAAYLNLKAGPSFGAGVLPPTAPHEARERDYFFVLAWWAWGTWAGLGAVIGARAVARRMAGRPRTAVARWAGLAVAALPLALNWRASTRTTAPTAGAAERYARNLLENAPPHAVLFTAGDNDTYPLWFAQAALGVRRDVAVVTVPMLAAGWYRAELADRYALVDSLHVARWTGTAATVAHIRARAAVVGRPVALTLGADDTTRAAVGAGAGEWVLRGLTLAWYPMTARDLRRVAGVPRLPLPATLTRVTGARVGDSAALRTAAARVPVVPPAWRHDSAGDGVVAWAYRQLACPAAALAGRGVGPKVASAATDSLEGPCMAR